MPKARSRDLNPRRAQTSFHHIRNMSHSRRRASQRVRPGTWTPFRKDVERATEQIYSSDLGSARALVESFASTTQSTEVRTHANQNSSVPSLLAGGGTCAR